MMYHEHLGLLLSARTETLRMTRGLSQEQSEYSPGAGRWSAGEVLHHLLLADQVFLDVLRQLINLAKAGKRAVVSRSLKEVNTSIRFFPKFLLPLVEVPLTIFNLFLPPFLREALTQFPVVPLDNPDIAQPAKALPIADLRVRLQDSFDRIEALLDANPNLNYRHMRYRHPLVGDNTALGTLRILAVHELRHHAQIAGILRSDGFPAAVEQAA